MPLRKVRRVIRLRGIDQVDVIRNRLQRGRRLLKSGGRDPVVLRGLQTTRGLRTANLDRCAREDALAMPEHILQQWPSEFN